LGGNQLALSSWARCEDDRRVGLGTFVQSSLQSSLPDIL